MRERGSTIASYRNAGVDQHLSPSAPLSKGTGRRLYSQFKGKARPAFIGRVSSYSAIDTPRRMAGAFARAMSCSAASARLRAANNVAMAMPSSVQSFARPENSTRRWSKVGCQSTLAETLTAAGRKFRGRSDGQKRPPIASCARERTKAPLVEVERSARTTLVPAALPKTDAALGTPRR
jgi:hypothetical protein